MPGPAKTPTKTLKMRGSWRAKTRANEPSLPPEIPDCPEWLCEVGRAEWDRVVPLLEAQGVLTGIDGVVLALYCDAYAEFLATRAVVAESAYTIKTDKGNVIQHPAVGIMHRAWANVLKAAGRFGMDPPSRADLATDGKQQNKGKSRFFSAG